MGEGVAGLGVGVGVSGLTTSRDVSGQAPLDAAADVGAAVAPVATADGAACGLRRRAMALTGAAGAAQLHAAPSDGAIQDAAGGANCCCCCCRWCGMVRCCCCCCC